MAYYPVALQLEGKPCIVVGAGIVALRKVEALLQCGAVVMVVAPRVAQELRELAGARLRIEERPFEERDLDGAFLVVVATDDRQLNEEIHRFAVARRMPVNVVDDPALCNFIVPSTLQRGDLLVSITTSGKSPALARRLRRDLEKLFPPDFDEVLSLMASAREAMKERLPTDRERELFWREFLKDPVLDDLGQLRNRLETLLKE